MGSYFHVVGDNGISDNKGIQDGMDLEDQSVTSCGYINNPNIIDELGSAIDLIL